MSYINAKEIRRDELLFKREGGNVHNKIVRGVHYRPIYCACCHEIRKTLLNREGKMLCRECYAKILSLRLENEVSG